LGCFILALALGTAAIAQALAGDGDAATRTGLAGLVVLVGFAAGFGLSLRQSSVLAVLTGAILGSLPPIVFYILLVFVELGASSGDCGATNPPANCFDDHGAAAGLAFAGAASMVMFVLMAIGAFPTWWATRRLSSAARAST